MQEMFKHINNLNSKVDEDETEDVVIGFPSHALFSVIYCLYPLFLSMSHFFFL